LRFSISGSGCGVEESLFGDAKIYDVNKAIPHLRISFSAFDHCASALREKQALVARFSAGNKDMLAGHQQEIQAERDRKLEAARKQRQIRRQRAA